jgi:hypothetical protein
LLAVNQVDASDLAPIGDANLLVTMYAGEPKLCEAVIARHDDC